MTSSLEATNGLEELPPSNLHILKQLSQDNAEYFSNDSSENGIRLCVSFVAIQKNVDVLAEKMARVEAQVHRFDFDEHTPGNGYRSFLKVANSVIDYGVQLGKKVSSTRTSTLFRKATLTKDVEACHHLICSLDTCFDHLETLLSWTTSDNLFTDGGHSVHELLKNYDDINQYCFYGRCTGFQFFDSIKNILNFILTSMTIFSELYYTEGSIITKASSLVSSHKYLLDPEQRARRVVNICQNASVDFCKAFWFLSESELLKNVTGVSLSVAVSQLIIIKPEPFTISVNGVEIDVPVPSSHIAKQGIPVRLISYNSHVGMVGKAGESYRKEPPARGLLIHCHGGGFVAQSSRSHECYLRDWAKQLKVPILSIDYSLAPEAPYPRALEETFFAYCWALKNHKHLGSTGERIVAAGDSAGANLMLATTLKCLKFGIPPPMGLFVAYVPTFIEIVPSPGRILSLMDPLLPFGFIMRCLKAYAYVDSSAPHQNGTVVMGGGEQTSDTESFEEISESDLMELQAHKSPISETSDTMTYGSLNSNVDLNLDSSDKCFPDLLDKFVLDSDTDTDGTRIPVLRYESGNSSQSIDDSIHQRVTNFVSNLKSRFSSWIARRNTPNYSNDTAMTAEKYLDLDKPINLLEEIKFTVPHDPYLSPFLADDEDLKKFPPVRALTVHMDPCIDDCVMFTKKLKRLGNDVQLDILDGLPHGFLNFSLLSKEAYEGSQACVRRISELLNLDGLPALQSTD